MVAEDFRRKWNAYRFPNGKRGFVGVTGLHDHFMVLSGGGLWTSFNVGRSQFMPWVVCDDAGHGNIGGMVHIRADGRNIWANIQKVTQAEYHDHRPFGVVETAAEYVDGNFGYRVRTRFTFAAGCAGFLLEPVSVENIGSAALDVPNIYYSANAGGEKVVPLPNADGWLYEDGRKTIVSAVEGGVVKFWIQENGYRHPDVVFRVGETIPPGESWSPSGSPAAVYRFEPFTEDGR